MSIPRAHALENQKLTAEAYVDLFEIQMLSGQRFYFKQNEQITWQGRLYEGWAAQINGVEQNADGQSSRPTLVIANKTDDIAGLFSPFIEEGLLDKATVTRRRVLRPHLVGDINLSQVRTWYVTRVASLNDATIVLELRSASDGHNHQIPARSFIPPDFPTVTLR